MYNVLNMEPNQRFRLARTKLQQIMNNRGDSSEVFRVLNLYRITTDEMLKYLASCGVKELEHYRPYDFIDVVTAPGNVEKSWLSARL